MRWSGGGGGAVDGLITAGGVLSDAPLLMDDGGCDGSDRLDVEGVGVDDVGWNVTEGRGDRARGGVGAACKSAAGLGRTGSEG